MAIKFMQPDDREKPSFDLKKWLRKNAPDVADEVIEELDTRKMTAGDVHQTTALGNEDEEEEDKRKTRRRITALEGARAREHPDSVDATKLMFDTHGSSDLAFEHFIEEAQAEVEKLRIKQKTKIEVECDPEELKALVARGDLKGAEQWLASVVQQHDQMKKKGGQRDVMVIRHGATHLNNQDTSVDRIRGWLDVPLSEDGISEAEKSAKKIEKQPPDVLFCSDLKRARETARIIADACGLPEPTPTKSLRPWDVGKFAGVSSKIGVPALLDYAMNKPNEKVPNGESFNDFRNRFFEGLSEILNGNDGCVGIVTHHRCERLLSAWEAAGFPSDGSIDGKVFSKKGEGTAGFEIMSIPQGKLNGIPIAKSWEWVGDEVDLEKIFEDSDALIDADIPVEDIGEVEMNFHVQKVDPDKQMVFGIWSVTTIGGDPVVDKQDDVIPTEELEKAVYDFVLKSREQGRMHEGRDVGRCIESMIYTKEKEDAINKYLKAEGLSGSLNAGMEFWWGGFKVDDANTWAEIKAGRLPEFSIGGRGTRD